MISLVSPRTLTREQARTFVIRAMSARQHGAEVPDKQYHTGYEPSPWTIDAVQTAYEMAFSAGEDARLSSRSIPTTPPSPLASILADDLPPDTSSLSGDAWREPSSLRMLWESFRESLVTCPMKRISPTAAYWLGTLVSTLSWITVVWFYL